MIQIKIEQHGKEPKELLQALDSAWAEFQLDVQELGFNSYVHILDYINRKIKRPGSVTRLTQSISYDELGGFGEAELGFQIGDVNKMDSETEKSWRALNYGSSHMVGKRLPPGIFFPGEPKPSREAFGTGRWQEGGEDNNRSYSPIVKEPIKAWRFVENLQNFGMKEFGKLVSTHLIRIRKFLGK